MDRKIATIVGAAAALVAGPAAAQAATTEAPAVPVAASYAELLEPIANPVQQLNNLHMKMARSAFANRAKYAHMSVRGGPTRGSLTLVLLNGSPIVIDFQGQ